MSNAERLCSLLNGGDGVLTLWDDATQDSPSTLVEATHIMLGEGETGEKVAKTELSGFVVAKGELSMAALYVLWQHHEAPFATYLTSAIQQQLPTATVVERQDIADYLRGAKTTSQYAQTAGAHDSQQTQSQSEQPHHLRPHTDRLKRAIDDEHGLPEDTSDKAKVRRILARQYTGRTRLSYLTPSTSQRSFAHLTKLCYDVFIRNKPPPSTNGTANGTVAGAKVSSTNKGLSNSGSSTPSRAIPSTSSSKRSAMQKDPIIIVPPSMSCGLNMFNVRKFLEQAIYQTPEEGKIEHDGRKPSSIEVSRKAMLGGSTGKKQWKLVVVDSTERFATEDWERVVAVFAGGMVWQFDGWMAPYNSPIELFAKVKGFFVKYSNEELRSPVNMWNVKLVEVHRNQRHLDQPTVLDFWNELEKWIGVNKPHLLS